MNRTSSVTKVALMAQKISGRRVGTTWGMYELKI